MKTTESGDPRGYDAGKKIKGRKRHIVTDTGGLLIAVMMHEADIQDRDGAPDLLSSTVISHPWLSHILADGGNGGGKRRGALDKIGGWIIEIIKLSDTAKGFGLLLRCWGWRVPSPGWDAAAVWQQY